MVIPAVSTENQVLFSLPQGKPDPQVLCSGKTLYTRARVPQGIQKGATCTYYSMNMIRGRIGKHPSAEMSEARAVEARASMRRKELTALREQHRRDVKLINLSKEVPGLAALELWKREKAPAFLRSIASIPSPPEEVAKVLGSLRRILQSFAEQTRFDDVLDYLAFRNIVDINAVNLRFLTDMGEDPKSLFEEAIRKKSLSSPFPLGYDSWGSLSEESKRPALESFADKVCAERYGLTKTRWHPTKGIETLIGALKKDGPLFASGQLGQTYYRTAPYQMETVARRAIWGWEEGDFEEGSQESLHAVVVVGAKAEGTRGFVYFVDPADGSDPSNPDKQRIYILPYASFVERISDLTHRMYFSGTTSYHPKDQDYGLHGPATKSLTDAV